MEHFDGADSTYEGGTSDDPSFDGISDQEYSVSTGFDVGIADGDEVDIDGDGQVDGLAKVSYGDLDGDGIDDYVEISVDADTNGDGEVDAVVIVNQYDTDGDGFADEVDMTYGQDTDGDGQIDTSTFSSGAVFSSPTDTDGDGEVDTVEQSVNWDASSHQTADDGEPQAETDDDAVVNEMEPYEETDEPQSMTAGADSDAYEADDVDLAYVDPATGTWVESSSATSAT
ncbi:MAG: hypothetical protein ACK5MR_16030 [Cumulibacter sp.]